MVTRPAVLHSLPLVLLACACAHEHWTQPYVPPVEVAQPLAPCAVSPPVADDAPPPRPASPSYPPTYPVLSASEREARVAAFRARNPGVWDEVVFDAAGYLDHAFSADRCLAGSEGQVLGVRDIPRLRELVKRSADLLGVDDVGSLKWLTPTNDPTEMIAHVEIDGERIPGKILIAKVMRVGLSAGLTITGHLWPHAWLPPKPPPPDAAHIAALKRPFVGKMARIHITDKPVAGPLPPSNYALTGDDLMVEQHLEIVDEKTQMTLRRVLRVKTQSVFVADSLPFVKDDITGAPLAVAPPSTPP